MVNGLISAPFDSWPMASSPTRRLSMEDFRPTSLQEIVGQTSVVTRLLRLATGVRNGTIVPPTLLLHGPPGIGKTTAVRAFAREILGDGDEYENSFSEMKAFDDRSPGYLAKIILNSRTAPKRGAPFRIVFFDEIDTLSPEAQNALRPAVEGDGGSSLYIFACNDLAAVSRALQSRCILLEFLPVNAEGMRRILTNALAMTTFPRDQAMVESIVQRANGIPREAIKLLLEEGGGVAISG